MTENSPTSLVHNSVFIAPNNSSLVQRHIVRYNRPYQNLEQIDYDLHHGVFDDVIWKIPNMYKQIHDLQHSADSTFTLYSLHNSYAIVCINNY